MLTANGARLTAVLVVLLSAGRPPAAACQTNDSLLAAANRAARAFRSHEFSRMVAGSNGVSLHLPGADPSMPVRAAQAADILRAFAGAARELNVEVEVARHVDSLRAYVEMHRTYQVPPGAERRTETLYVGLRRDGPAYRVSEIRVVR